MILARAVVGLGVILAALAAEAQIYRWLDQDGRTHVGDTPPPGARDLEKLSVRGTVVPEEAEPYALQLARKTAPVTLYSTPSCPLCNKARDLLNARGVPFKELSVVTEKQVAELVGVVGRNALPSLVVGTRVQEGFEESLYHGMLDAAGYPKSGVVPPRSQPEPRTATAEPQPPAEADVPAGPYAPGARRSRPK